MVVSQACTRSAGSAQLHTVPYQVVSLSSITRHMLPTTSPLMPVPSDSYQYISDAELWEQLQKSATSVLQQYDTVVHSRDQYEAACQHYQRALVQYNLGRQEYLRRKTWITAPGQIPSLPHVSEQRPLLRPAATFEGVHVNHTPASAHPAQYVPPPTPLPCASKADPAQRKKPMASDTRGPPLDDDEL